MSAGKTPGATQEIRVPDIGDFQDVEIIDVLVKPGDRIEPETALITLETEKATMDVPAPMGGVVESVAVKTGDRVSKDSLILTLAVSGQAEAAAPAASQAAPAPQPAPAAASATVAPAPTPSSYDFDIVVLGAGPGGYTAAFRAADLGMKVGLVERWPTLGGVCLNVGCIPSKALLHAAKVIEEAAEMSEAGIKFGKPKIDAPALREWKNKVVGRLTGGLTALARQRKVEVIRGTGVFVGPHELEVSHEGSARRVTFAQCIIAAGSESVRLPGLPDDPRIIDSTGALELDLPKRMLVVGGGIIGLEMATVYDALGVKVSVVELTDGLIPGCDRDLVRPLEKRIAKRYERIMLKTRVTGIEPLKNGLRVTFEADGAEKPEREVYDKVLLAVGRTPNGGRINAEAAGVLVNERGFIPVDRQMRTNVPHIFAIGDIVGPPMLAHKASHEGKLAAEVAHGAKRAFDARVIPSVAYTDPEIAWVGLTETDAKDKSIPYEKATFPWAASGRALSLGRDEGFTKLLFDKETGRVVGGGIVGPHAGDLISEVALAIEMGADAADIGLTIHPHPTLSETVAFAAEAFEGTLTDLYIPKKRA
ncbi:MAG: dihydrolipoyl dehydrogenase [Proteobacteria bacterium]|nr:MAG: dihydrolipoyl dehydrogenase [Pseudomonadota bacterium]